MKFPVVTLSNEVRVMNFNSPHSFLFEDGTILGPVEEKLALETQLNSADVEYQNDNKVTIDVQKKFVMSQACFDHLVDAVYYADFHNVDIILAPLPVVSAVKEMDFQHPISAILKLGQKLRTIYVVNRVTKEISITKFCV